MAAALEQWEIDLRKQLEGRINSGNKRKTWEDELVDEIKDVPPVPTPRPPHHHHHKKDNTLSFIILLTLLGIITLCAFDAKSGWPIKNWIVSKFQSAPCQDDSCQRPFSDYTPPPANPQPHSHHKDIDELRADVAKLKADQEKLAGKVKYNHDRITLMGVMMNENFLIVRNNYDRGHLIFLNRDWTIDQMPHYVQLSDEDRAYLQKFCKPNQ